MWIGILMNKWVACLCLPLLVGSLEAANYLKLSDKTVNKYCKEVARPKGLRVSGRGGAFMHDIKQIILHFETCQVLSINDCRALYVEMVEELLGRYNDNEKIRPYLNNYPFELKNYKLMIAFLDAKKNEVDDGNIALMFVGRNDEICYEGYDSETKKYYTLHREPYSEAKKIVLGEE